MVIREYADDIFAVQGILIGNWGEMHGSRYLTPDSFRTLTDTMIKAVDGACPVAVRKPAQWRELTLGWTEQEKKKLTLFNDGIFGSETDLGTYGTLSPETPGQKICSREEELEWQKNEMCGKFCRFLQQYALSHLSVIRSLDKPKRQNKNVPPLCNN